MTNVGSTPSPADYARAQAEREAADRAARERAMDAARKGPTHVHPTRRFVLQAARVLTYAIYLWVIFVEIILLIGFLLLLGGANPGAGFVGWAYRNLDRVMSPFRGIFTQINLAGTDGNVQPVFDTSVVFAMIVYGIVALALSSLLDWLVRKLHHEDVVDNDYERNRQWYEARAGAQASGTSATLTTTTHYNEPQGPGNTPAPLPPR